MSKRVVRHNPNSARLPGTNQALLVRALTLAAAIVSRNPDAKVGSQPCGRSEVTKKTITWRSPKFTPASSKASSRAATPSSERSSTPARNLRARQVKKVQQALSSQKTIYQRKLERKRREKQLEATNPQLPSPPPTEPESEESTDNMLGYQKRAAMHTKLGTLERHNMYHGTIKSNSDLDIPRLQPKRNGVTNWDGPSPTTRVTNGLGPHLSNGTGRSTRVYVSKEALKGEMHDCHYCQLASFSTHANYPIEVVNEVDDATFPSNFRFIENSILTEGVTRSPMEFHTGCECDYDGACGSGETCSCPTASNMSEHSIMAYKPTGAHKGCLKSKLLESRYAIFECHEACQCSTECPNRVVDNGRKIPLEIFRTDNGRGWGVRSKIYIPRGTFIDKYVGEILTASAANARRKAAALNSTHKDVYLFALDKFHDTTSHDLRDHTCYEVDGEFYGSVTRFINHSCEPNCRIFARVGDISDKHLHDLAFFAVEDIEPDVELSFDYIDAADDKGDNPMDVDREALTVCLCGSKDCRGYLW